MNYLDRFEKVIKDHTSGSVTILNMTICILRDQIALDNDIDVDELRLSLKEVKGKLPNFLVLHHFIDHVTQALHKIPLKAYPTMNQYLLQIINTYEAKWKDSQIKSIEKLISEISPNNKTILLHSNSTNICELFRTLSSLQIYPEVFQTSSEPLKEGKIQAEKLSSLGFKVNFIQEVACSRFIHTIDLAIFGADAVYENFFINKTGTFQLALLFNYYKKPVYVIADVRKKRNENADIHSLIETKRPARELWADASKNIKVHNLYFELIPNTLVDKFFF